MKGVDIEEEESETQLQMLELVAIKARSSGASAFVVDALLKFARIQMALSRQAHKQARHVIALTWAIVGLTFVLLIFTMYLSYDTYQKSKDGKEHHKHSAKANDSP